MEEVYNFFLNAVHALLFADIKYLHLRGDYEKSPKEGSLRYRTTLLLKKILFWELKGKLILSGMNEKFRICGIDCILV